MRIASLILGLMLSAWCFFEAFALSFLEVNSALSADDKDAAANAGGGVISSLLAALAAALVIAFPLASAVLFTFASIISFVTASSGYGNHWVYGFLLVGLSAMSFFGWRGKKRDQRMQLEERARQLARDDRLEALLRQQAGPN